MVEAHLLHYTLLFIRQCVFFLFFQKDLKFLFCGTISFRLQVEFFKSKWPNNNSIFHMGLLFIRKYKLLYFAAIPFTPWIVVQAQCHSMEYIKGVEILHFYFQILILLLVNSNISQIYYTHSEVPFDHLKQLKIIGTKILTLNFSSNFYFFIK